MYFYHGNKHYYLTKVFLADPKLKDALYLLHLSNEEYENLCYALADELWKSVDDYLKNNSSSSANEFYNSELKKKTSVIFSEMQAAIARITGKNFAWTNTLNKTMYIGILESMLYGAIKHFFYENRDKYLPQYDWYLINQNPKRKEIMDILFLEFDKLAAIADAIKYYQDADDIPEEFLIRLQEITGFTMNTYGGIFSSDQLRNLTKHLYEVWREKGSIYSIELFFACMGIDCAARELWFDRRLYFNTSNFNDYTKLNSTNAFGYYLTPETPHSTTYPFSNENVEYSMYTAPRPSRVWSYVLKTDPSENIIEQLLGYEDSDLITTYTFFKSNYLLLDFKYINKNVTISKDEIAVFKELLAYMLPAYMRIIYVNDYGSDTGGDDWDILKTWDVNSGASDKITTITDKDNVVRPVEIFKLFDTDNQGKPYYFGESEGGANKEGASYIRDFYPPEYCGSSFISGSFIKVTDTRLDQFIDANFEYSKTKDTVIDPEKTYYTYDSINDEYVVVEEPDVSELSNYYEKTYYFKATVTSGRYDTIGGIRLEESGEETEEQIEALKCYPLFYDDEGHNYYRGSNEDELVKDDGQWFVKTQDQSIVEGKAYYTLADGKYVPVENPAAGDLSTYYEQNTDDETWSLTSGTVGTLVITTLNDKASAIETDGWDVNSKIYKTVSRYFFEVNGSSTEIYPNLFAEDNNGSTVEFVQGSSFEPVEHPDASELNNYYEATVVDGKSIFAKTKDTEIDTKKLYFIPGDELFDIDIEPQVNFTYEQSGKVYSRETFDPQYTEKAQNLFEASTWTEDIPAINDLYNNGTFIGDIQYEYFEYSNPIQCLEANLDSELTITLI